MSSAADNNVLKVPLLNNPTDYIHRKRHLYAFIRKDDPELIGLSSKPENLDQEKFRAWFKKATKTKSLIILSLGPDAISQTQKIIDDDEKTAKDLWEELNRIYTTTSGKPIQNLRQKLDALVCDETKDWRSHVSSFLKIYEELATYDVEFTEDEKTSKLIRPLPSSFSPLAMVLTIISTTFEKVLRAVEAEISRRANPNNPQKENQPAGEEAANNATKGGRGRGNGFGRCFRGHRGRYRRGRGGLLI